MESIFNNALKFDLGLNGDITTNALIGHDRNVKAKIIAKESGIIAGIEELKWLLNRNFIGLKLSIYKKDGGRLKKGDKILDLEGSAKTILMLERTVLNFLQRFSGIATLTQKYVKSVPKNVLVCPTRKTLWGALDKKACIIGGGGSHRINLNDAILIKDNHVEILATDIENIASNLKRNRNKGRFIEIEVSSMKMAIKVAEVFSSYSFGVPVIIMFDNMTPIKIRRTLDVLKRRGYYKGYLFEASGGITLKNIKKFAKSGVDIISVGALTHSVPGLNISMNFIK